MLVTEIAEMRDKCDIAVSALVNDDYGEDEKNVLRTTKTQKSKVQTHLL